MTTICEEANRRPNFPYIISLVEWRRAEGCQYRHMLACQRMQEGIREKLAELERIQKLKNGMIFYGGDGEKKMDEGSLVVKVGEDWRDEDAEVVTVT